MNELNGQTRTTNDFYKQLGQTIGNELSSAFAQAESSGESFASSAKNIAKQVVAAALAESISRAIANAFETAKNAGPAAAIIGPILAATAASGVKALFNRIPAFAEGGMVTMGPQLALIGDNPSGKEAVIPFEKMGRFLSMAGATQPQHVFVTGRISGGDILLTNERALDHRTRVRNF
jgi:hypothetical protein